MHVLRDKPSKPFWCLDALYRRELVRVYLTNVEGICRRFVEEKRAHIVWTKHEGSKFRLFWEALSMQEQRRLLTDRGDAILKVRMVPCSVETAGGVQRG